jgi:hypothetical protein
VAAQPEDGSRVAEHLDLRIELSGSLDLNGGFMKRVALTAVVSSLLTLALVYGLGIGHLVEGLGPDSVAAGSECQAPPPVNHRNGPATGAKRLAIE